MSDKPRSSGRVVLWAILLLCTGAGAWYYMNDGFLPVEKAVQSTPASSASVSAPPEASMPAPAQVEQETSAQQEAGAVQKNEVTQEAPAKPAEPATENTTHQVSGTLNDGPRPVQLSEEEKRDVRVEKALASKARLDGGDTVSGALAESATQPEKEVWDPVVTRHFVSDFAAWLVNSYRPSIREDALGSSKVTLRSANARYSTSRTLCGAERDPFKARNSVLSYVYSPGMLEALYRMYGPRFLKELEGAASEGAKALSAKQMADMLQVYAGKLNRIAASLDAASRLDISALVAPIRQASAQEETANEAFAKAYAAHNEARDSGRADIMAEQSKRLVQSIRAASEADARKERVRQNVVWALKQKAEGAVLSDADLIFLAEWLERRRASKGAVSASASICRQLAGDLAKRSAEILDAEGASPQTDPAQ